MRVIWVIRVIVIDRCYSSPPTLRIVNISLPLPEGRPEKRRGAGARAGTTSSETGRAEPWPWSWPWFEPLSSLFLSEPLSLCWCVQEVNSDRW